MSGLFNDDSAQTVSHAQLYMWRAIIAIAHADGRIDLGEEAWFLRLIQHLKLRCQLTQAQENILRQDLAEPPGVTDMLRQINEPAMRANVIHYAGIVAHLDGLRRPSQEAIIRRLRADQMDALDLDMLHEEARHVIDTEMAQHDIAVDEIRATGPLGILLRRMGVDVMG